MKNLTKLRNLIDAFKSACELCGKVHTAYNSDLDNEGLLTAYDAADKAREAIRDSLLDEFEALTEGRCDLDAAISLMGVDVDGLEYLASAYIRAI